MKPICIIGARAGSKGVPLKNIRLLAGKPLIAHTIKSALKSNLFQRVIVSTEDAVISRIAKKYGAEVPFRRPKNLASDKASMDEVLYHAIIELKKSGYNFDIIVNRDCTVPFIKDSEIKGSIRLLRRRKCDLVVGVYRQHHNPYFNMMEPKSNGYLEFSKKLKKGITNRQRAPIVYQLNGLFTIDVKQFLKYKKIYMPKILPYEISTQSGLMIDTEFEFQIANAIAKKQIRI